MHPSQAVGSQELLINTMANSVIIYQDPCITHIGGTEYLSPNPWSQANIDPTSRRGSGGGGSSGSATLETLMDKVPFHGKPKIVDLTTETKIAERITEAQLQCGEVRALGRKP